MGNNEKEIENKVEKKLEKRKDALIKWIKDPYNLTLVGIMAFAIIIRLYFFILTKNQPLWYDEAEYMSGALNWALGIPFHFSPQRPVLFHFLIFLLMKIGFNELAIKFTLSVLPSILISLFTYLLVKDMYNKKTALVASFIMAFFWMSLFYSMRMMTDMFGFLLGILTFYCFWKGYVEKKSRYFLWLMGFFISLSIMIRLIGVLFGLALVLFLLFTERLKFLKNKDLWIALLIAVITISPFLLWYYNYHGDLFGFVGSNVGAGQAGAASLPIAWHLLKFIPIYFNPVAQPLSTGLISFLLNNLIYIFFFIGLFTLTNLIMGLDMFFKEKKKNLYSDFFNILSLLFILGFFIFYFKMAEDRWMIAMAFPLFVFASKGIIFIADLLEKKSNKILAIIFIVLVLILGAYVHMKFAGDLINLKKDSYSQLKEAGIWVKDNSQPNDIVFSNSITQSTYYSERQTIPFGANETEFWKNVEEKNPRYLIVSAFEAYPDWATSNVSAKFMKMLEPVNVFFLDTEKTQPILIIYQLKEPAVITPTKTNSSIKN